MKENIDVTPTFQSVNYEFRNIENISNDDLATTWNSAFSDYIVPMNLTPKDIEDYLLVTGVDKSLSYGAFYQGVLVGLLLNSIDNFRGKKVAYDAMTGIVPEHRGKGLFSQLFEYTRNSLKNSGIKQYYLEVITTNEKAYSIYKKKGGMVVREFVYLECSNSVSELKPYRNNLSLKTEVNVMPLSDYLLEMNVQNEISQYEPSIANRIIALSRNINHFQIAFVEIEGQKISVVFNQEGGIPQIKWNACNNSNILCFILKHIIQKYKKLRVSNIPITETNLINELLNMGFKILVNQYEMCIEF
ncbi:MAG: GNAT family N-acetyltransferase [Candidatus Cloacimonetes bacterium]|nr:GNAT family N-acetyltransferase [Candidatus Cloacimonadota bacterium]